MKKGWFGNGKYRIAFTVVLLLSTVLFFAINLQALANAAGSVLHYLPVVYAFKPTPTETPGPGTPGATTSPEPGTGTPEGTALPTQPGTDTGTTTPGVPTQTPSIGPTPLPALRPASIFGTELFPNASTDTLDYTNATDAYWIRIKAFDWDSIEPENTTPENYHWDQVNDGSLQELRAQGYLVIATIRFAPDWAQKYPGYPCGPIKEDAFDDFAEFLTAIVQRYSAPPYDIHYWEVGNEPDIDHRAFAKGDRPVYGCWGEQDDPYYGGGYFAQMLSVAYPAIKAADPQAQVLNGALMMDCDPTHPMPGANGCVQGEFFEGMLRAGGAAYFDLVSFNASVQYIGSLKWDEEKPEWEARGGAVLGKVSLLREWMADYGVDKPIVQAEGSLGCPEWSQNSCNPPGEAFFEAQANYVAWLFVKDWAAGLKGVMWYSLPYNYWRYTSLVDDYGEPRPAYYAYDYLTSKLKGASYVRQVTDYDGVRTYEFATTSKRIWVLWTPDEQPRTITLPPEAWGAQDKYGNIISLVNNQITVKSPVYVDLAP